MILSCLSDGPVFQRWLEDLHSRARRDVTFQQLRRGIQSLSARYVERRSAIDKPLGVAVQWAFAAFYAPLHFLTLERVLTDLAPAPITTLLDLGCGTGAAGAAWAMHSGAALFGIERMPWACAETRGTRRALGLRGDVAQGDLLRKRWSKTDALLLAYTVNELDDSGRAQLLERIAAHAGPVLIVEPIAKRALRWWNGWEAAFVEAGGRSDTWRFAIDLPASLAELDHAAGLDHREFTARTLYRGYQR